MEAEVGGIKDIRPQVQESTRGAIHPTSSLQTSCENRPMTKTLIVETSLGWRPCENPTFKRSSAARWACMLAGNGAQAPDGSDFRCSQRWLNNTSDYNKFDLCSGFGSSERWRAGVGCPAAWLFGTCCRRNPDREILGSWSIGLRFLGICGSQNQGEIPKTRFKANSDFSSISCHDFD